jgi:hypothetical protein
MCKLKKNVQILIRMGKCEIRKFEKCEFENLKIYEKKLFDCFRLNGFVDNEKFMFVLYGQI